MGALELLERAATSADGYFSQTVEAWETLADMAAERGDRQAAEQLYRRILRERPSLSGTSGSIEMSLAEILLDYGRTEFLDEAMALLNSWIERKLLKFDGQLFRWHLDLIRVAEATGDEETMRRAASVALDLASRGPRLPRHPDVGLVQTDEATLRRWKNIARAIG
jgi:predicted Zn-dependent protease